MYMYLACIYPAFTPKICYVSVLFDISIFTFK